MRTFLTLIRWHNLLFLAVTLCLMQRAVIDPILFSYGLPAACSWSQLLLLIGGVVSIAAGGFAINDYFDVKIDAINKPEKLLVGRIVDRRYAIVVHQCCTVVGVLMGFGIAYWIRSWSVAILFLIIPGLLWFYSASYKRQFVIGNVIIAFNAALFILLLALANGKMLQNSYGSLLYETTLLYALYGWIGFFAGFAFLSTLIREITKDIEDEEGDRELECHTLPIIWGVKKTKVAICILIALMIAAVTVLYLTQLPAEIKEATQLTFKYLLSAIVAPLLILMIYVARAKSRVDFRVAALLCKIVLGVGMLYSIVLYYTLAQLHHFPFLGH